MTQVIEGTWEDIKRHEADLAGHKLMLIVDPADVPNTIQSLEHLEELLIEGMNSGPAIEVTPESWNAKRRRLIDLHSPKPSA